MLGEVATLRRSGTATTFTLVALAFDARLGERYKHGAERAAGAMPVMLTALFAIERLF